MASPSPSDLLWVIGFRPQGRWIVPIVREAVRAEWPAALQSARQRLGDDTMARELMEAAIEMTYEQLAAAPPVTVKEARQVLRTFYWNAIRKQHRARSRLVALGTGSDLETLAPMADETQVVNARIDIERIFRETPDDIRKAILARYGASEQWDELGEKMGRSKDAVRMASGRELKRLREKFRIKDSKS